MKGILRSTMAILLGVALLGLAACKDDLAQLPLQGNSAITTTSESDPPPPPPPPKVKKKSESKSFGELKSAYGGDKRNG